MFAKSAAGPFMKKKGQEVLPGEQSSQLTGGLHNPYISDELSKWTFIENAIRVAVHTSRYFWIRLDPVELAEFAVIIASNTVFWIWRVAFHPCDLCCHKL
jgi:hypothetical protein